MAKAQQKRDGEKTDEAPVAKAAKVGAAAPLASSQGGTVPIAGSSASVQSLAPSQGAGPFGTSLPAPPVGDLPPDDDKSANATEIVKKIAASVLASLPNFMAASKMVFPDHEKEPHLHGALAIAASGSMSSYKAPWDEGVATNSLSKVGLYEASANVTWLNPFPVSDVAQCIAGDVPTWAQVVEAADLFMSRTAAQDKVTLASPQGSSSRVQRMLFPIVVPAHCATPDVAAATKVLGNFTVVAGHLYVWAWYLGMHRALVAQDIELAASLWQMGLTTSVQLRHGLTDAQLATWSINAAEQARFAEGVLTDTFPAFAAKALTAIGASAASQGAPSALAPPQGAQAKQPAPELTGERLRMKCNDLNIVFRGSKVSKAMAAAILMFKTSISPKALQHFQDIELTHGRDVLSMHYNKISRLVQICGEASKHVGISTPELVEASLDALHFALRGDLVKPNDVTAVYLDQPRTGTTKADADCKHGFVVRAIARFAFIRHLSVEKDELSANASNRRGRSSKT